VKLVDFVRHSVPDEVHQIYLGIYNIKKLIFNTDVAFWLVWIIN